MNFKGMDILAKHVPELNSAGGRVRIALYAIFLFCIVTAYFIITDNIPTWSIDSQIIITTLGFLVLFPANKSTKKNIKNSLIGMHLRITQYLGWHSCLRPLHMQHT